MNCGDLLNIKEIRSGLRLMAGEKGVNKNIRWIYFADCMQCLDGGLDPAELIHGEELVIVTNKSLTDDDNIILDMIKSMVSKNIAALVINQGQVSKSIIDYCNQIDLPLYELSVELHLIDFSQIVCKVLVEEESRVTSRERILTSILYSDRLNVEDIIKQANYLGVNLSGKYRIAVLHTDTDKAKNIDDEGYLIGISKAVKKQIENEFRLNGLNNMMIHSQMENTVVMYPERQFGRDITAEIFKSIADKLKALCGLNIYVGIGSAYEYIAELKNSYQEAKNTLQIISLISGEDKVYFYEDIGIYAIISQIKNGKFLDDYTNAKLGKLTDADRIQAGELCKTLETYIDCGCNANAAAEKLFIHRNTMRYRLDKIKKTLGSDINDISVCLELKLAFIIKKFRENRSN